MKGLMLIPPSFKRHLVQRDDDLGRMLEKHMNFKLVYKDNYNPKKIKKEGYNIVLALKGPQYTCPNAMMSLIDLDKKIKLICYYQDIHWRKDRKEPYLTNMRKMLERADKILCCFDEGFRSRWPEYINKFEWFPEYFSPHKRYADLPYNEKPIMKGLLVGAIYADKARADTYPLRNYVLSLNHPYIQRLEYSGQRTAQIKSDIIGDDYAKELNKYFCCITDSSKYKAVVSKYFEIPAVGSLLLADDPSGALVPNEPGGLKKLGFISGKHYIRIDQDNFTKTIEDVVENPKRYEHIRKAGRKFVLRHHSIRNRFKQMKKIIYEMDN